MNDEENPNPRRKFLKQLAFGSLGTLLAADAANAAVRDVIYPGRRIYHRADADRFRYHKEPPHGKERIYSGNRHSSSILTHAGDHKALAFEHVHTGDKLKLTYFERGRYVKEALHEINYLLRDFHNDQVHPIDIALLDQLYALQHTLGVNKPFHIISGYRSPQTNAQLRREGHAVAEHSFHMQGRAIDIRLERIAPKTIRNAALRMAQGGVGYYPQDNFVHLDTGRFRTW